jgi:rod shape-determining protein MreD
LKTALKVFALLALGILVQTTFGNDLRIHDVAPDFMMLLAVSAGFAGGPDQGAVVGFASGLISDLFLQSTPFGLSALAACLAGFVVGWAKVGLLRPRLSMAPLVVAVGTALGVLLFVVVGYIVGQAQLVLPGRRWLVAVALVEACYAAALGLPAVVLMGWALRAPGAAPTSSGQLTQAGVPELSTRRHLGAPRSRRRRRERARAR